MPTCVEQISKLQPSSDKNIMVYFGVKSLFTIIPLKEIFPNLYKDAHGIDGSDLFVNLLRPCIKDDIFD